MRRIKLIGSLILLLITMVAASVPAIMMPRYLGVGRSEARAVESVEKAATAHATKLVQAIGKPGRPSDWVNLATQVEAGVGKLSQTAELKSQHPRVRTAAATTEALLEHILSAARTIRSDITNNTSEPSAEAEIAELSRAIGQPAVYAERYRRTLGILAEKLNNDRTRREALTVLEKAKSSLVSAEQRLRAAAGEAYKATRPTSEHVEAIQATSSYFSSVENPHSDPSISLVVDAGANWTRACAEAWNAQVRVADYQQGGWMTDKREVNQYLQPFFQNLRAASGRFKQALQELDARIAALRGQLGGDPRESVIDPGSDSETETGA